MIPIDGSGPDWAFRNAGATSATAFATLTLEHSLYRR
jgi:hypothetical protein